MKKKVKCLSDKSCKGNLVLTKVEYKIKHKGTMIKIPDVEVWVCDTCGERFYPYEASKKIDVYKEYSGRLMLRVNPELHLKLAKIAKKHHRSINQEVNYLIEQAM